MTGFDTSVAPATRDEWQSLVAAVLNKGRAEGAQYSGDEAEAALRSQLPGGLIVDPIYLRPTTPHPIGMPGKAPFTRGRSVRDPLRSWDVRPLHEDPDATGTRAAVLADLELGASSVWVHCGPDGVDPADLAGVLADVRLDLAPVSVSAAVGQSDAAKALLAVLAAAPDAVGGSLGLDPIGAAAAVGGEPDWTEFADLVRAAAGRPGVLAITIDTRVYHNAGAHEVDVLAYAVATGVEYLRRLNDAGMSAADVFALVEFRIAATADQFLTAATLRALRTLWAQVGESCGVNEAARGARTHAVTSERMLTRADPWVNILRGTLACFGASLGGADVITTLPFDHALGLPTAFSRRIARNTQALLADESNVGRVSDPAGGSWYVESLTDDLGARGWAAFQAIEASGGMAAALAHGSVAQQVSAAADERAALVATRKVPITGVSTFPLAGETTLTRPARAEVPTASGALVPVRDSGVFEELRERAAALGDAAVVTVVPLGSARESGARQSFVTNLLAAGGIATTTDNTAVVVLASNPAGYATHAAEAIRAARAAGATTVVVAGRARELPAGVTADDDIFDGKDVVTFLHGLLDHCGDTAKGTDR